MYVTTMMRTIKKNMLKWTPNDECLLQNSLYLQKYITLRIGKLSKLSSFDKRHFIFHQMQNCQIKKLEFLFFAQIGQ